MSSYQYMENKIAAIAQSTLV